MKQNAWTRIWNWLFSHIAEKLWSVAAGAVAILVLVPFDTHYGWCSLVLAITAIYLAFTFHRHWVSICIIALVLMVSTNLALPLLSSRDIYFLRCSRILDCVKTIDVSYGTKDVTIYPVLDPVKWFIWNKLSRKQNNLRIIESGGTTAGQIVLNSPTERVLAKMQRDSNDADLVNAYLRMPISVLTLDMASEELAYEKRNRARILEWRAPVRTDTPGFFSAVGKAEDILSLSVEVVRADLTFRTLLTGDLESVLKEAASSRNRSLREEVRKTMIATGLENRLVRGNVFSIVKLLAIRNASSGLGGLAREYGENDALYQSAVLHYTNMLLSQASQGPNNPAKLNFDPREAVRFKDDLIHGIFFMTAKLEGTADPLSLANQHYRDWIDVLNGKKPDGKPIKTELFEKHGMRPPAQLYSDSGLSATALDYRLSPLLTYSEQYDRVLYEATYDIVDSSMEYIPLMMSILRDRTQVATLRAKSQALLEIIAILQARADYASTPARDIILSELRILSRMAAGAVKMADAFNSVDASALKDMLPEDPIAEVTMRDSKASLISALQDMPDSCELRNKRFMAHFIAELLPLAASRHDLTKLKDLHIAADHLWGEYGKGQRCSSFIPGLMLLHGILRLAADPRQEITRTMIDDKVGADAGWLQDIYRSLGHADLYEGRTLYERLTGQTDSIDSDGNLQKGRVLEGTVR